MPVEFYTDKICILRELINTGAIANSKMKQVYTTAVNF